MLTKEMKMPDEVENLMTRNVFQFSNSDVNTVKSVGDELRMYNIRNRKATNEEDVPTDDKTKREEGGMMDNY